MYRKTIQELEQEQGNRLVIDIRKKEDFEKEAYPDAVNIYWETFCEHLLEVPKETPLYLICYTGEKSDELAEELREKGYEAYSVEGGYRSYLRLKLSRLMEKKEETEDRCKEVERSIVKKFRKEIWRKFTKAVNEYQLIQDGDKIAVCISGGKDSMLMAKLFQELERHGQKTCRELLSNMRKC